MDGYYGMRRKRNLKLLEDHERPNEFVHTNPAWDDEPELEEGYEEVEEYYHSEDEPEDEEAEVYSDDSANGLFIDGKLFVPKKKRKKETFMDTHVRYTTYLEKNLLQIIRMLQESGQVESITKFINDSIKDHLLNHYHNDN
ncbi:hypothetical protein P4T04_06405 [Bacillus badius]|uniref:hypothetical protein n=1 Tax=Bacillus badius TaxID=1455 RepID=UPI002E2305AC|nr:hypothetical protein [Bacillus badius]